MVVPERGIHMNSPRIASPVFDAVITASWAQLAMKMLILKVFRFNASALFGPLCKI
jgi:hypothetical protein